MTDVREYIKDSIRVFVVPVELLEVENLDIYEKMTYVVLRSYANAHKSEAFPSYSTIAKMGSMSRRKAIDCVKTLIEKGIIKKEQRFIKSKGEIRHTSNLYTLDTPEKEKEDGAQHAPPPKKPSAQHAPPSAGHAPPSAQHAPEKNYLKEPINNNGRMGDLPSPDNEDKIKNEWDKFKEFCQEYSLDGSQTMDIYKTWKYQYDQAPISIVIATIRELLRDKYVYKNGSWTETEYKNMVGLFHHRMKTWREMAVAFEDIDGNGGWN